MITKTLIAKRAVTWIIGAATGNLIRQIIKNNVEPDSVTDKAAVVIGSYVLGAIAADAAKKWTDAEIDKLVEWYKELVYGKPEEE